MTLKERIKSLLTAANTTTGKSDTDLTAGVQSLIDGFGGGGVASESGVFTLDAITKKFTIPVKSKKNTLVVWFPHNAITGLPKYSVLSIFAKEEVGYACLQVNHGEDGETGIGKPAWGYSSSYFIKFNDTSIEASLQLVGTGLPAGIEYHWIAY